MPERETGPTTFAAVLRRHRRAARLTQHELAERSGLSVQAISALERGLRTRPHRDTVAMLAGALELTVAQRAALEAAGGRPPPAGAAGATITTRMPVPADAGSLIGRDEEAASGRDLLTSGRVRLLTVTGPPGVGKTRLAAAIAQSLQDDFADGIARVGLESLTDPELVAPTICGVLGIRDESRQPAELVAAHLGQLTMLLVLDNFEHVMRAAPLVSDLLQRCPRLHLLATSRAPLRLRGEHELALAPLPLDDAVKLFTERAQARQPRLALTPDDEATVTRICARLDGLPLALELAARWISLLGPEGLLDRLQGSLALLVGGGPDLPERQRTMRKTLEWSYGLLSGDEQAAFRGLSVFAGSAPVDAAEDVLRATSAGARDPIELIGELFDRGLVGQVGGPGTTPRVTMLYVVREFAHELLRAAGEAGSANHALAGWLLELVRAGRDALVGHAQEEWLTRLDAEIESIRAVLGWSSEHAPEMGLTIAAGLRRFWLVRGRSREGRAALKALLDGAATASPTERAEAMTVSGDLSIGSGDLPGAVAWYDEALPVWRTLEDQLGVARCLEGLGSVAIQQADLERGIRLTREALGLRRARGDALGAAASLNNLGAAAQRCCDLERAGTFFTEALELWRGCGDVRGTAIGLVNLGENRAEAGAIREAEELLEAGIELTQRLGDAPVTCAALETLARVTLEARGGRAAAAIYGRSLRLALDSAIPHDAAGALEGVATLAACAHEPGEAARLLGAAGGLRKRLHQAPSEAECRRQAQLRSELRRALGAGRLRAEQAAGSLLSPETAIGSALRLVERLTA